MLRRALRILHTFAATPGKAAWLEDRLTWKLFQVRQRRQDRVNRAFDLAHGTDTAGEMPLEAAGVTSGDAARGNIVYRPLWETSFHATMNLMHARLPEGLDGYTFVDIGSGKGKLLLLASTYPFRAVTGIEYAPGLHEIAQRNVARFNDPVQRCRTIQPVLGDALTFTLPSGPVVAMIFNSFDEATTAAVISNLVTQRPTGSSPVFIVYENLRRATEIGRAFDVTAPWERIEQTRNRIIVGNVDAVRAWRGEFAPPHAAPTPVVSRTTGAAARAAL